MGSHGQDRIALVPTADPGARAHGCGNAGEAPVRMRLAVDLWAGYFPAFIAAEKGWFVADGLEVTIELPQDTKRSLAELAAGDYNAVAAKSGGLLSRAAAGSRSTLADAL